MPSPLTWTASYILKYWELAPDTMAESQLRVASKEETALRETFATKQSLAEKYVESPTKRSAWAKKHIEEVTKLLKKIHTEVYDSISKLGTP